MDVVCLQVKVGSVTVSVDEGAFLLLSAGAVLAPRFVVAALACYSGFQIKGSVIQCCRALCLKALLDNIPRLTAGFAVCEGRGFMGGKRPDCSISYCSP